MGVDGVNTRLPEQFQPDWNLAGLQEVAGRI